MNQYGFYDYYDSVPIMPDAQVSVSGEMGALFGVVMGAFLVAYLLVIAVCIAFYVFQSIGFYTIAKRRGIHNPWLAWLPVGNMWILGSISDQYQYVKLGKVTNRRKVLLVLYAATLVISALWTVGIIGAAFNAVLTETETAVFALLGGTLLGSLVIMGIAIAGIVLEYIALYDVFRSCNPDNSVVFLILSILFPVTIPFFLFFNRKKDDGMPPRKKPAPEQLPKEVCQTEPVAEEIPVQEVPAEPVAQEQTSMQEEPTEE